MFYVPNKTCLHSEFPVGLACDFLVPVFMLSLTYFFKPVPSLKTHAGVLPQLFIYFVNSAGCFSFLPPNLLLTPLPHFLKYTFYLFI